MLAALALTLNPTPVSATPRYVKWTGPSTVGPTHSKNPTGALHGQAALNAAVSGDTVQLEQHLRTQDRRSRDAGTADWHPNAERRCCVAGRVLTSLKQALASR
jgi:hypothetical protein